MPLQLRRGTAASRTSVTPAQGELLYTTDTKLLYIGDGTTAGGNAVGGGSGTLTITSPLSGTSYNGSSNTTIALASGYGDTQNPYDVKTAKYVLAAPNGTNGAPTFRALVASDIPTLNQNTTGSAGSVANALIISTGLSGTSYNGSSAVTVALADTYGDTKNPYGSKPANYVLASPSGASGTPSFRALTAADIPRVTPASATGDTSSGTVSWNSNTTDQINISVTSAITIAADSGTPVSGQKVTFCLQPNTSSSVLTWNSGTKGFRAVGATIPLSTTASKTTYVGCVYNSTASKWDVVAVAQEA